MMLISRNEPDRTDISIDFSIELQWFSNPNGPLKELRLFLVCI